jgi:hypothetical protein
MEERKRRISPVRDANEGNAAQRRKLSNAAGSQASSAEDASTGGQLDAALGLEDGFLEVSLLESNDSRRSNKYIERF